jgi:prolyl-tRNA editing enzyme YbaK/EbsC (Cys-tRNA(Pro) deacylase)
MAGEVVRMSSVSEHLRSRGLSFEVIPHTKAYTSIDEAEALGLSADEVLKVIALKTASGYALAVIPGGRRLDMKLAREAVGDNHARLATEEELERDFAHYELGALPPLGSLLGAPVHVDTGVMEHDTVLFAAGSQTESVKLRAEDLFRAEQVTVVPLARRVETP